MDDLTVGEVHISTCQHYKEVIIQILYDLTYDLRIWQTIKFVQGHWLHIRSRLRLFGNFYEHRSSFFSLFDQSVSYSIFSATIFDSLILSNSTYFILSYDKQI